MMAEIELPKKSNSILGGVPTGMDFDDLAAKIEQLMDIKITELGTELIRGPKIHSVLSNLHRSEGIIFRKWQVNLIKIERLRKRYYDGKMSGEYYSKHPLPEPIIIKADIPKYLSTDEHVIAVRDVCDELERKISMIEEAMKRASRRGYEIKSLIEWQKFQAGVL